MNSTAVDPTCTACRAPATSVCQGCVGGINAAGDETPKTVDCSVDCQAQDWQSHKTLCKQLKVRKQMYRAGKTLQGLFYAYRERAFDTPLCNIERFGTVIDIHAAVGQPPTERWRAAMGDPKIKTAVLAWPSGPDGSLYMGNLVKSLLQGISNDLTGACVKMKVSNRSLDVRYHDITPSPFPFKIEIVTGKLHYVFKVTLKHDAGVFALELAGAEFGYFGPVLPWDKYMTRGAKEVLEYHNADELPSFKKGDEAAILRKRIGTATRLFDLPKTVLAKENITMEGLLKPSDAEFEEKQSKIVAEADLDDMKGLMWVKPSIEEGRSNKARTCTSRRMSQSGPTFFKHQPPKAASPIQVICPFFDQHLPY